MSNEWSFGQSVFICVDLWLHLFRAFKNWDSDASAQLRIFVAEAFQAYAGRACQI